MKIDLPITGRNYEIIDVVSAEIVDVAPHLPMTTWAVHRVDSYAPWVFGKWCVTNIETGAGIDAFRGTTKKAAIQEAHRLLAFKTPADAIKAFAKYQRKFT